MKLGVICDGISRDLAHSVDVMDEFGLTYAELQFVGDTPRATLTVTKMGEGQLADQFAPMAGALRDDAYDGVISFESVYHPGNGDFEAGFRACIDTFKTHFG